MAEMIEIRCPIYGFVTLDKWELDIISEPAFQRLRRVRQLAWTDTVYPGAMHTRFEHSLGVMHMATMLYDGIVARSAGMLREEYGFDEAGMQRHRKLIRLAALLHDVGHGPFSHAAEELVPVKEGEKNQRLWRHEEYSIAIIKNQLKDVIEDHKMNINYNISANEIAGLIEGGVSAGGALLWHELISSQLDADRMDYLLRDSYHSGVEYGKYDWRRLVNSVELVREVETGGLRFGVADGGRHAAEAMIIARYMMFSQVYFHKTRVIVDYHLQQAVREMLPDGKFPPPVGGGLDEFIAWDDWKVLGNLADGEGGEHGARLKNRDFFKPVWETPEVPTANDDQELDEIKDLLGDLLAAEIPAGKSWYKLHDADLLISMSNPQSGSKPLSSCSTIVGNMKPSRCTRLYVRSEGRDEARRRLNARSRGDRE